jgi:hypothetical protein
MFVIALIALVVWVEYNKKFPDLTIEDAVDESWENSRW